jgi:hypothetical protein
MRDSSDVWTGRAGRYDRVRPSPLHRQRAHSLVHRLPRPRRTQVSYQRHQSLTCARRGRGVTQFTVCRSLISYSVGTRGERAR